MTLPLISTGAQIFIIGFTLLAFALVEANKIQNDDPSNVDMNQMFRLRYQMFTAMFFMVGSMFFIS